MSSASEDDVMDTAGGLEDDLFGSDDGDGETKIRELSDRELDSGDDEGRSDRAPEKETEEIDYESGRDARVLDQTIWRHPVPKPIGGEFNNLRLPKFLGIEPRAFKPDIFELPVVDHHTNTQSTNFSASATASSTIRYRKNPSTGELESNTVIYKWSDGSTTISVGDEHYEMQTKSLAPPRENKTYHEVEDSHLYVASPSLEAELLLMVGHMANQYTVRPNKNIEDDALEKLQKSLAAATRGGGLKGEDKNGPQVIANTQDPELQKKRAEVAEKERMKLQRRRETAAEKALLPTGARRREGGLNVDDLEGRGRRAPAGGRKQPRKRPNRTDYDSEDDDGPRGRNREDEYDKDDGFLADSDEEEEIVEDDDDEDAIESEVEEPRKKKHKKSAPVDDLSDADADAEADLDDEEAPPVAVEPRGRKGRNVIEDDDDDE